MRRRVTAADALESVLGGMQSATRIRESLALAYWERAAGPQAAAATEPEAVRQGTLFIRTKNSVWSQELTFLKFRLIADLNQMIGRPVIREIVFKSHGVDPKLPQSTGPTDPTPEEISEVVLQTAEKASLDLDLKSIFEIADQGIREAAARQSVRSAKLRRWRLEHGWKECRHCGAAHLDHGDDCPLCRLEQS